jgi:hypothetical protein
MTHEELAGKIFAISAGALAKKDSDEFLRLLEERDGLVPQLVTKDLGVDAELLKRWLDTERRILARLKEEEARLLQKADDISRGRKAIRRYSLGCLVPTGPLYCNKKG